MDVFQTEGSVGGSMFGAMINNPSHRTSLFIMAQHQMICRQSAFSLCFAKGIVTIFTIVVRPIAAALALIDVLIKGEAGLAFLKFVKGQF